MDKLEIEISLKKAVIDIKIQELFILLGEYNKLTYELIQSRKKICKK